MAQGVCPGGAGKQVTKPEEVIVRAPEVTTQVVRSRDPRNHRPADAAQEPPLVMGGDELFDRCRQRSSPKRVRGVTVRQALTL